MVRLRARVDLPSRTRYRLAGVGLAGFLAADAMAVQEALFAPGAPPVIA